MTGAMLIISGWVLHSGAIENSASVVMLKYLFVSNDGLIGFYGDGTVLRYQRCNQTVSNINVMVTSKPFATYNDSKTSVTLSDGTVMPLYDDGQIATGWRVVSYQKVTSPQDSNPLSALLRQNDEWSIH